MLESKNQMRHQSLRNHTGKPNDTDQSQEAPENDLITALAAEIDVLAAEIEESTQQREKLIQWRRELLEEQQAAK